MSDFSAGLSAGDDLYGGSVESALPEPKAPSWFSSLNADNIAATTITSGAKGIGSAIKGLANIAADTLTPIDPTGKELDPLASVGITGGKDIADWLKDQGQNADDYFSGFAKKYEPDQSHIDDATKIIDTAVGGLVQFIGGDRVAPFGGNVGFAQSSSDETVKGLTDKGVDAGTARDLGTLSGAAALAMTAIPGAASIKIAPAFAKPLLESLPGRIAYRTAVGAGAQTAFGLASRGVNAAALEAAGYHDQAKQEQWNNAASMASDAILGAAFGNLAHESHGAEPETPADGVSRETQSGDPDEPPPPSGPSGDQIRAALVVKNVQNRDETAPGISTGPAGDAIHAENLRRTQAAFANDESPSDLLPYTVEDSPRERTPAQQIAHEIEWAHYRNSQFDTMHGSEADNATLEKYRAAGVDTELTGSDLRESIAKAGLGDAEAQAPTPDFIPHPVNHEAIARVHEALNDSSFSDEDRAALLEALPLEDTEALARSMNFPTDENGDLMYSRGRPKDPEQEASVIKAIANGEVHAKAAKRLGYKHENSFNTIARRIRKRAKELRGEGRDDKFIANYFNSDEKSIGKLLAEPETLNAINPDTGLTRDQDRQREYMLSLDEARGAGEKVSNAIIGSEFEPMHTAAMVAQGLKKARNAVRALTDAGKSKAEVAKAWLVSPDVIDSLMALDRSNYKDGPSAQQARILELLTPRPDGSYRTYEDIAKSLRAETVHSDDPGSKATAESVAVQVINLRNAGIDVPYRAPGKKGEGVSLEQVWALHDQGMSQSAIARALKRTPGRINQLMKSGRPEGVPESKPTAGRYDLATREARKAWVDSPRNVLDAPIPGEASTSREYGFMLDGREPIVVQIKPLAGGLAEVDWGFPHRFKENPDADPFAPMAGGFTLSEKGALLARLVAIMEKDSGKFARDGYKFFPATEGLGRTYQKLFARFGQLGYKFVERDGDAYLIRGGAELTDNGRLIRAEDSAEPQPKWEDLDADEIEARQDAYYQSLETLGTRSDDGRAMGGRAGDDGQDAGAQGGEADERFSRSSTGRSTPDELKAKLEDRIGTKDLQPALDASNVILGNDQTEVRPSVTLEGHGGLFDPRTGKVYINADQTSVERALPVLLHEMGEHHSMEAVLGPRLYGALQKQLQMLHDNGHPTVRKAFALAQEHANRPDHLPSERLAYTIEEDAVARGGSGDIGEGALPPVKFENGLAQHADRALAWLMENAPDLPIVQRTLAAVRQWLARTFGEGFGRNLTLDDIHQLAIASLRRGLREAQVKAANEGDIFSSMARRAPTFYSALSKSVSESKTGKASAQQWKATLAKTPGLKKEELEWTGVNDWLDAQSGPVSREALQQFVDQNGVQVQEVLKGAPNPAGEEIQRELLPMIEERDRLLAERGDIQLQFPSVRQPNGSMKRTLSPKAGARMTEIAKRLDEIEPRIAQLGTRQDRSKNATKWSQYTLPGAEAGSYREMLLVLPHKNDAQIQSLKKEWDAVETEAATLSPYERSPDGHFKVDMAGKPMPVEQTPERADRLKELQARSNDLQSQIEALGKERGDRFNSSHFDEKNILAHVRLDSRTDAAGRKTLFVQEVQSDWHQKGREQGYATPLETETTRDPTFGDVNIITKQAGVPDAPFKNNAWAALVLKRMVRLAAEQGYDSISWAPGDVQNARYSLEQHIKEIGWTKRNNGGYHINAFAPDGRGQSFDVKTPEELVPIVGKDIADKIVAGKGEHSSDSEGMPRGTIKGVDLKMGGDGMRAFYDKILVNIANDIGKKYGAKVGETEVDATNVAARWVVRTKDGQHVERFSSKKEAEAFAKQEFDKEALRNIKIAREGEKTQKVHTLPLSDSLRSQALDEGFPLFSAGRFPKNWRVIAGDKPALTEREKYNEALFDQIENHDEFGDLHADIGDMARRLNAKLDAAPEETAASAAERDGFADGAHAFGSDAELNDLAAKADAGATAQELAAHPVIQGVAKEAASQVPTMKPESARDASFWRKRRYVVNGKRVPLAKALDHLERQADSAGKPAKFDKQALVVIGPQGAGKSSFIKAWVKAMGAAVPDADMAKEVIPEYKGGQGTIAAHAEGLQLRERVTERLLGKGRNIIIERVGFNPDNEAKMRELVAMGYEVRLAHIDVSGDEAARRATKRFLATGRYPMNFADYDKAHTLRDIFNKLIETDAVKGHIQVNADGQIPHVTAEHNSPELAGHVSDGLGGLLADRPGSERGDGRSDEAAGAGQERNPDPVKQTLADDPGLKIATDEGEIPGEKALADAEADEAGAKEMAKGFKAAASCAIQHGLGPGIRVSSDIAAAAFARRTAAYAAGAAAGGVIANMIQTSPTSERWNETALMNQQRSRMALGDYNRRNIPNDLNNAEKVTPVDAEIQQEQPALSELQAPSDADTAGGAGYAPGQTDSKVAPADAPKDIPTFGLPSPVNDGSAYAASVAASRGESGKDGVGGPEVKPNLLERARQEFPAIAKATSNYGYKENFQEGMGWLEHWSKGEPDSFDPTRESLEIYNPKTRPLDIAGDIVSHNLARGGPGSDPKLTSYYNKFEKSMTPWQRDQIHRDYQFDREHWNEKRPFQKWYNASGLPAYFRGYAFDQWHEGVSPRNPTGHELYTPDQKTMFDEMMTYLRGSH